MSQPPDPLRIDLAQIDLSTLRALARDLDDALTAYQAVASPLDYTAEIEVMPLLLFANHAARAVQYELARLQIIGLAEVRHIVGPGNDVMAVHVLGQVAEAVVSAHERLCASLPTKMVPALDRSAARLHRVIEGFAPSLPAVAVVPVEAARVEAPAVAPVLTRLSPRTYDPGDGLPPVLVTDAEESVLGSFIGRRAQDLPGLRGRSGQDEPARHLRNLVTKYDGRLAPFIHLPGGKGRGGYSVAVRQHGTATTQHPPCKS